MTQIYKIAMYTKLIYLLLFISDRFFYYKGTFLLGNNHPENHFSLDKVIKLNFFNQDVYFKKESLILSPHPIMFVMSDYSKITQKDSTIIKPYIFTFIAYDLLIAILCLINIFNNNSRLLQLLLIMDNFLKIYTIWRVEFNNLIEELARQKELKRFFEVFIPGLFAESFKELQGVVMLTIVEFKSFIINIVMIILMTFVKLLDLIEEEQMNVDEKKRFEVKKKIE